MCTGFWWVNLRERGHCGDPDVDGRINFKMDGGQSCAQGSGGET
jgi:hypothetical protein